MCRSCFWYMYKYLHILQLKITDNESCLFRFSTWRVHFQIVPLYMMLSVVIETCEMNGNEYVNVILKILREKEGQK